MTGGAKLDYEAMYEIAVRDRLDRRRADWFDGMTARAERWSGGEQDHLSPADRIYCLQRDLFDFVLVAMLHEGQLAEHRIDVPEVPGV
jgi:hypothetical protein